MTDRLGGGAPSGGAAAAAYVAGHRLLLLLLLPIAAPLPLLVCRRPCYQAQCIFARRLPTPPPSPLR